MYSYQFRLHTFLKTVKIILVFSTEYIPFRILSFIKVGWGTDAPNI
jgi:hypothetical protein